MMTVENIPLHEKNLIFLSPLGSIRGRKYEIDFKYDVNCRVDFKGIIHLNDDLIVVYAVDAKSLAELPEVITGDKKAIEEKLFEINKQLIEKNIIDADHKTIKFDMTEEEGELWAIARRLNAKKDMDENLLKLLENPGSCQHPSQEMLDKVDKSFMRTFKVKETPEKRLNTGLENSFCLIKQPV